jgi:pimeloyl-ACP methyl ester carboxylesterase
MVLVHGAGNTAGVWADVQALLSCRSVAVNLPGRRDRVAGIADVALEDAVGSIIADVDALAPGPLVLVGHSAGGILLPQLAARWADRLQHMVFVAGLCAPHGEKVVSTVRPHAVAEFASRLAVLREKFRDCMLDPAPTVAGMRAIDEATALGIDSLNYMDQPVSWEGVPAVPRTFVRCLRDRIQPRPLQEQLISNCGASRVVDLDSGHTPALSAPKDLARALNSLAS